MFLEVRNVFQNQILGVVVLDYSNDLKVNIAQLRVSWARVVSGLGERLTREPGAEDVVPRHGCNVDLTNISQRTNSEVLVVGSAQRLVNLRGEDTLVSEVRQRQMKPT